MPLGNALWPVIAGRSMQSPLSDVNIQLKSAWSCEVSHKDASPSALSVANRRESPAANSSCAVDATCATPMSICDFRLHGSKAHLLAFPFGCENH